MSMQYTTPEAATNALAEHLHDLHRHFVGAVFRIAFYKRPDSYEFLTGNILFRSGQIPTRKRADYGYLLFVEQWAPSQNEAHALIGKLLEGKGEVAGQRVNARFSNSQFEHHTYPRGSHRWSGLQITSRRDREPNRQDIYLPQDPVVGFDLEPYWGASHAIGDWIFDAEASSPASNSVPNSDSLIITVPDTRARIIGARWTPGKLRINTEVNTPDKIQMQIAQLGSAQRHQLLDGNQNSDILIPNDTREILVYLVDQGGDCITQLHIDSMHRTFGDITADESNLDRAVIELGRGENERVEYKPFMSPNNDKETEFVATAIAFANTLGGTVYVGVHDRNGSPYGSAALHKLFKGESKPLEAQAARLQWLITNKIKPIPTFSIQTLQAWGEPVVSVSIERSREGPCSTHENHYFVRRAATNYRPDANELQQLLSRGTYPFSSEMY
jgi:hypothetical protein